MNCNYTTNNSLTLAASPANGLANQKMKTSPVQIAQSLNLIASQLEAASSLVKYAGDDLHQLLSEELLELDADIRMIAENLNAQAATIAGSGAFFLRLAEDLVGAADGAAADEDDREAIAPG